MKAVDSSIANRSVEIGNRIDEVVTRVNEIEHNVFQIRMALGIPDGKNMNPSLSPSSKQRRVMIEGGNEEGEREGEREDSSLDGVLSQSRTADGNTLAISRVFST